MTLPTDPNQTGTPPPGFRDRAKVELAGMARWLQRSTSRENLVAGIKTLAWLVPLTLLIWIYAEREQVYTTEDRPVPIEVRSSDADRFVELRLPGRELAVTAQLSGPRGKVEEVEQRIARGDKVVITVPDSLSTGQVHELETAQQLAHNAIFASNGVSVSNCKPMRIPVYVDEYIEREVEVQAPSSANLVAPPIFEPRRVTVRAPRHVISQAEEQGNLAVYADLAGAGLLDKPGPHEGVTLRVQAPLLPRENVTYTPSSVKATFEIKQADQKYTIPSVAIFISGPRNLLKRYNVECADTLANVTVIGPPDQIDLLRREDSPKPKAELEVSRDDLPAGVVHTGRLRFLFPDRADGVRVSPEDAQRAVEYKLVEQAPEQ